MTKTKIAIYLVLIFVAGAVAGGAVSYKTTARREPPRERGERPTPEQFAEHVFTRMSERLELSPEQMDSIRPIFMAGFKEVRDIQERSLREVEEAIQRSNARISKELTPEQQARLEEMNRERQEFFKKREGHSGPRRGGSRKDERSGARSEEKSVPDSRTP